MFLKPLFSIFPSRPSAASYWPLSASTTDDGEISSMDGLITYLQGLRGIAALAITFHTFIHAINPSWDMGYGFGVPVSCVIAGYTLAFKPMQQFRRDSWELMMATATSYVFRRAIRILLPAVFISAIIFIMVRLELYSFANSTSFERPAMPQNRPLSFQLAFWCRETLAFISPLQRGRSRLVYNPAFWTLPVSLCDSILLVLVVIGIARTRRIVRWVTIGYLFWQTYQNLQYGRMAMLAGLSLAEIDTREQSEQNWDLGHAKWMTPTSGNRKLNLFRWVCFLLGLIFMGMPRHCSGVSADNCKIEVQGEFWQYFGAMMAVAAVSRITVLQRWLSSSVLQYLGQISFGIFLVNHPILLTFGYRILARFVGTGHLQISANTFMGLGVSYVLHMILVIPVGHLTWRFLDLPVQRLGIWIETACSSSNGSIGSPMNNEYAPKSEIILKSDEKVSMNDFPGDFGSMSLLNADMMLRTLKRMGWFLLPSLIQNQLSGEKKPTPKLHPTAYLDGLRGWASLFVLIYHTAYKYHPSHRNGYGVNQNNMYIVQLPIIRLMFSGTVMVYVFFVISGFSLSYQHLKAIRQTQSSKQLFITLSSSIFRRGARLFIPVIAITFLGMLIIHTGVFEGTQEITTWPDFAKDYKQTMQPLYTQFFAQFYDWFRQTEDELRMTSWIPRKNAYNPYTWSIPVEYRCSMALFAVVLALANTKAWIRMTAITGFFCYLSYLGENAERLFLMGIVLAELSLIQSSRSIVKTLESPSSPSSFLSRKTLWWAPFTIGLFLISTPEINGATTPGWETLCLVFNELSLQVAGIPILIISIHNNQDLQWLFNNQFSRYLGAISFALYLCQFITIHTVGYWLIPFFQKLSGTETFLQYELGFWAGNIFVLISTFWFADVFWRAVDMPSVTFAKWLEKKCILRS